MAANPMTQFNVYRIGPEVKLGAFDISFTNNNNYSVSFFNFGGYVNSILIPYLKGLFFYRCEW